MNRNSIRILIRIIAILWWLLALALIVLGFLPWLGITLLEPVRGLSLSSFAAGFQGFVGALWALAMAVFYALIGWFIFSFNAQMRPSVVILAVITFIMSALSMNLVQAGISLLTFLALSQPRVKSVFTNYGPPLPRFRISRFNRGGRKKPHDHWFE